MIVDTSAGSVGTRGMGERSKPHAPRAGNAMKQLNTHENSVERITRRANDKSRKSC